MDPSGHSVIAALISALIGAAVGSLIGATAGVISAYIFGDDPITGLWTGAFAGATLGGLGLMKIPYAVATILAFFIGGGAEALNVYQYIKIVEKREAEWDELFVAGISGGISGIISFGLGKLFLKADVANKFFESLLINLAFTRPLSYSVMTTELVYAQATSN